MNPQMSQSVRLLKVFIPQLHLFISGLVQGVGFRYFVRKEASKLCLNGWVKNLPDGRVEAVFQGNKNVLEQIYSTISQGNNLSRIDKTEAQFEQENQLRGFIII